MSNEKEENNDKEEENGKKILPPVDPKLIRHGSAAKEREFVREKETGVVDEEKGE